MTTAGQILLAANPLNLELIGASLALFGLILLGAMAIVWADRWRKRTAAPAAPVPESANDYQTLYEKGVVSKEEYERIRAHLHKKLLPGPPAPSAPPTMASPPTDVPPPSSNGLS